MRTLDFSEKNLANQKDVVKEEIRVNVQNRPYGLFFWTDLSPLAFDKWENAHDGYGSFADLDAAKLEDVKSFHATYYGPNNAVLGVVGDVDARAGLRAGREVLRRHPGRPGSADRRRQREAINQASGRLTQTDALAHVPGLALGWKIPARRAALPRHRGARRDPARWRRLAPLPELRQGRRVAAAGHRRAALAARRLPDQRRADPDGGLRALQARQRRRRHRRQDGGGDRPHRRPRSGQGRAGAGQDQDARRLLRRTRAARSAGPTRWRSASS